MKYPMINKQPRREVNIPQLSGGLNLRDGLTMVKDNQMTECVNMWYKDGMLRTRPPFVTNLARLNKSPEGDSDVKITTSFSNGIKLFYKGFECVCATNKRIYTDQEGNTKCNIEFEFQAADKLFAMPQISGIAGGDNITYFCAEMGGTLYCYISDYSVWKLFYSKDYEYEKDRPIWENVSIEERYVPTAYAHCQRTGWDDFEGTFFEGYNLIGKKYKMIYSAYNEADSDTTHPMRYKLGQELADSGEIEVEITSYNSEKKETCVKVHSIKYDEAAGKKVKAGEILIESFADGEPEDGLYLFVRYNYVGFLFENNEPYMVAMLDTDEKVKKYGCNEDNVIITASYNALEKDLKKIFNMTQNTWFGGTANGINGGSRLFVCGNTNQDEKSLVVWSGLDNPLYFGENCYKYVGSKSRAVTAFGKQGENLIIFKEDKIYASYYQQNTNIDADALINQTVVDFEANSTYFPVIQINGYIGCDCPGTIQMCRNRLVWANTKGCVYTLVSNNQYNEHTVYEISEMIAPKLKEFKDRLTQATSADFAGHYILFFGDSAWVMDYCCYGYQYIYSYSKTDDGNALIPWYFWDFSFLKSEDLNDEYKGAVITVINDVLVMRAYYDASTANKTAFVGFAMREKEYGDDIIYFNDFKNRSLQSCNSKISSSLATKLFEFGQGVYSVNVDSVAIKTGSSDGEDIKIDFITEQGAESYTIEDKRKYEAITATNFIRGKVLHPCVRQVSKFGLKIYCENSLCVAGLFIKYRLLGGIK